MVHDLEQKFISTRLSKRISDVMEDHNTQISENLNYASSDKPDTIKSATR